MIVSDLELTRWFVAVLAPVLHAKSSSVGRSGKHNAIPPSPSHSTLTLPLVPLSPQCLPRTVLRSLLHHRTGHAYCIRSHLSPRAPVQLGRVVEEKRAYRPRGRHQVRVHPRHRHLHGMSVSRAAVAGFARRYTRPSGTRSDDSGAFPGRAPALSGPKCGENVDKIIYAADGKLGHRRPGVAACTWFLDRLLWRRRLHEPGEKR